MSLPRDLASAVVLMSLVVAPAFAGDQSTQSPLTQTAPPLPAYLRVPDNAAPAITGAVPQPKAPVAADFDALPAARPVALPARAMDWSGFYIGGQFAYSDASGDFSNTTQASIAYGLRNSALESQFAPSNWPVLGSASHGGIGYGGFAGYNLVYTPVVFGLEANYDQASLSLIAPNSPISRVVGPATNGDTYLVNVTGSGTVTDLDFATVRARAGWIFGNFLPYAFGGVAIGRANVNITETTAGLQNPPSSGACVSTSTPPCTPFSFTGTAGKNSEWLYGATVGAGLDVALTRHIFLRAEYEFVHFTPVASLPLDINTVRAGAGIKF